MGFRCASALLALCGAAFASGSVNVIRAQANPTAIVDQVQVDTRKPIDFHAAAFPESVYVGQQSTYQVGVFVANSMQNRLRRNPEYVPPELRGLLSYDLGAPRQTTPPNAPEYRAHVFQRAFFPVAAGKVDIPSPQLSYSLPRTASYFSGEDRFVVRAETAHLVVKPLPRDGQPSEFTGAVGVYNIESQIDTVDARVGDPLLLKMRVDGIGNVKLIPRPPVEVEWASVVAGTERLRVDSSGTLVRGAKEFEWILTPQRDGRVSLPSFTYHYFDPYLNRYREARTEPTELEILPGALSTGDASGAESKSLLSLRETAGSLPTSAGAEAAGNSAAHAVSYSRAEMMIALAILLCAPLPALAMFIRQRSVTQTGAIRKNRAELPISFEVSGELDREEVARKTRRALHAALSIRLVVDQHLFSSRRQLQRLLRRRGVTRTGAAHVALLLEELDAVGFSDDTARTVDRGQLPVNQNDNFAARARECFRIVDAEAIPADQLARWPKPSFVGTRIGLVLATLLVLHSPPASAQVTPQISSSSRSGELKNPSHLSNEIAQGRRCISTSNVQGSFTRLFLDCGRQSRQCRRSVQLGHGCMGGAGYGWRRDRLAACRAHRTACRRHSGTTGNVTGRGAWRNCRSSDGAGACVCYCRHCNVGVRMGCTRFPGKSCRKLRDVEKLVANSFTLPRRTRADAWRNCVVGCTCARSVDALGCIEIGDDACRTGCGIGRNGRRVYRRCSKTIATGRPVDPC